ncbi:MAG: tRNA N6-adenosine threonylcarbamoyltransferase [candidate division WS2 bacterium]|nr:tRNA N6-adenosine threonylcarbamoyltransferase [Candidatus Lithacetigena glycinireducens]
MKILGIETSCDETSVGIINDKGEILSNLVYSQVQKHAPYGGIVPEVASREHVKAIGWVYNLALEQARTNLKEINLIAVTAGPGLQGPLLVGISFAKGLSLALNIPLIGVNHLMGHIYSCMIEDTAFKPPFLALLITGGNTLITLVEDIFVHKILGSTRDDAAGECLDKAARLLGLGYPGGPAIEKAALGGNASYYRLPVPLKKEDSLDFSFSGLKTAVYYLVEELKKNGKEIQVNHLSASVQEAVFSSLLDRLEKAQDKTGVEKIAVVGGVASNERLKYRLREFTEKRHLVLSVPSPALCTDNGVISAFVGLLKHSYNRIDNNIIDAQPFLTLQE